MTQSLCDSVYVVKINLHLVTHSHSLFIMTVIVLCDSVWYYWYVSTCYCHSQWLSSHCLCHFILFCEKKWYEEVENVYSERMWGHAIWLYFLMREAADCPQYYWLRSWHFWLLSLQYIIICCLSSYSRLCIGKTCCCNTMAGISVAVHFVLWRGKEIHCSTGREIHPYLLFSERKRNYCEEKLSSIQPQTMSGRNVPITITIILSMAILFRRMVIFCNLQCLMY